MAGQSEKKAGQGRAISSCPANSAYTYFSSKITAILFFSET
jgi:hypothetical protein